MAGKVWSEQYVAAAVAWLKGEGWPEEEHAITRTIAALKKQAPNQPVPAYKTLLRWANGERRKIPAPVMAAGEDALRAALRAEVAAALADMDAKREQAPYKDLGIVAGILIDKLQLLSGEPTETIQQNILVNREGASISRVSGNTASSTDDSHRAAAPLQRPGMWPALGKDGSGNGLSS